MKKNISMKISMVHKKANLLMAIAHPNRIKILEELRSEVKCNCELAPALGLEQSNLSRHLKVLTQSGILISWKDGLRVNYKIADVRIFEVLDQIESVALRNVSVQESEED